MNKKTYLGDSVYAEFDGFSMILTTENGYPDDPRNKLFLEPEVYFALVDFWNYWHKQKATEDNP